MTEDTGSRALLSDPTRRSDGLIARVSVTTQPDPACTAVTPEELAEIIDSIRHLHRPEAENPAYCNWCGDHWPCAQIVVCDALAASEARLAEVEREREALRRMARQLIDVTGADGFRWYVDGPAELGDVVARAGTIIGYMPWAHPAARSAGEAK